MKLDKIKPPTRSTVRLSDILTLLVLPPKKWVTIRILDEDIVSIAQHWIDIVGEKSRKQVRIPKLCLAYDSANHTTSEDKECPYCSINNPSITWLLQVIDRTVEEDGPSKVRMTEQEKKTGIKDKDSSSWTPVKILAVSSSVLTNIKSLKDLNKRKTESGSKTFSVAHPNMGCDISLRYDPDASGADKYKINIGQPSKLKENYLLQPMPVNILKALGIETLAEAKRELGKLELPKSSDLEEDDSDYDLSSKKKKRFEEEEKPRRKSRYEEDDEEEEKPRKKSRYSEDDEEEKPRRKSRYEEDDEEEEKPRKKSKKKTHDYDDEDEDDTPF